MPTIANQCGSGLEVILNRSADDETILHRRGETPLKLGQTQSALICLNLNVYLHPITYNDPTCNYTPI